MLVTTVIDVFMEHKNMQLLELSGWLTVLPQDNFSTENQGNATAFFEY